MKWYFISSVVLCLVSDVICGAKFPSTFKRCKVSPELDNKPNDCLKESIGEAIRSLGGTGNKELGVVDIDPMRVSSIKIEQGESRPISIKLLYTDNDILGLKNFVIDSVNGKLSSPKDFEMVIKGQAKSLQMVGPYSINGRMLVLPIQGEGHSFMGMDNMKTVITIKGDSHTKNGKEYLKIKSLKMTLDTSMLHIKMENLFNGDKALGDNMNRFLNDNWQDIFNELGPPYAESYSAVFQEYARRIFDRVPFKDIFLVN